MKQETTPTQLDGQAHHYVWRRALEIAKTHASGEEATAYWERELQAFDRIFPALVRQNRELEDHWDAVARWKEEGERMFGDPRKTGAVFQLAVWWADRPWRKRKGIDGHAVSSTPEQTDPALKIWLDERGHLQMTNLKELNLSQHQPLYLYEAAPVAQQPPLPGASPATKGQCNDERACGACWSGQGSCEVAQQQAEAVPFNHATQLQIAYVKGLGDGAMHAEAVPVVTDAMALAFHRALTDGSIGQSEVEEIKVGLRAALAGQQAEEVPRDVVRDAERYRRWRFCAWSKPSVAAKLLAAAIDSDQIDAAVDAMPHHG